MTFLGFAVLGFAGAVGAWLRFSLERLLLLLFQTPAAWNVVLINTLGTFFLGVVSARLGLSSFWGMVLGIGFCGAFTTFSSWIARLYELVLQGRLKEVLFVILASLIFGGAAFVLGVRAVYTFQKV